MPSITGFMIARISAAFFVTGNRTVSPSSTRSVNGFTSKPLSAKAWIAAWVPAGRAGKITPSFPTMVWHSSEPRNATQRADSSGASVCALIESPSPLYMETGWPIGPMGTLAMPRSTPCSRA